MGATEKAGPGDNRGCGRGVRTQGVTTMPQRILVYIKGDIAEEELSILRAGGTVTIGVSDLNNIKWVESAASNKHPRTLETHDEKVAKYNALDWTKSNVELARQTGF